MLHLPVSKYILLYNHYDNSEHSDRDASDIYQVIGHAKCECVCVCQISSWFRPVQLGRHAGENNPFSS